MGWCLLSCQFPLIRHSWLSCTGAKLLSCLRRCLKPWRRPTELISGALQRGTVHDPWYCITQCKIHPLRGGTWCFQLNLNHILTHWILCFMGFPHPQWIKTVIITSKHGHWNCEVQDPLQDPLVVISLQSFIFLSILFLSFFLFLVFCCYSFLSQHKGPPSYPQQKPAGWGEREGGKENLYKLFLCKWCGQSSCLRKVTEVADWAGLCFSTKLHPNKPLFVQYRSSQTGQLQQTEQEAVSYEDWIMMLL